jgi:hypothetical protein
MYSNNENKAMLNNPNPRLRKICLTNSNLNNFKMFEAIYRLKNYRIVVPLNGITSVPNLMKIYQAVQKLIGRIDRQTGW